MHTLISADNTWTLWAIVAGIAAVSIWLEQKYKWANKLTGAILALIMAMVLANFRIIPTKAPVYDMVWEYIVPLAIPMLLFNANLFKIGRESGRILIIYLISGIGTVIGAFAAFFLLRNSIPDLNRIGAIITGTYTGGSINFAAMSEAFHVGGGTVSAAVVADNLLMALYFFVLMILPASRFILSKFTHPYIDEINANTDTTAEKTQAAQFWNRKEISLKDIAFNIAISLAIIAVSSNLGNFLGRVIPVSNQALKVVNLVFSNQYLLITTLTLILATIFHKDFTKINGSHEIGTFMIYLFFAVIGVPASIQLIIQKSPLLLVFCAVVVSVNMIVSIISGKLLGFSIEEIIIASNANIGGPTTAAAMAIAQGWEALIVPSILVGTLGYVIGNYYGLFVGTILGG